ncbi:hypothetical protein D9M69_626310 [compost metagenome]
MFGSCRASSAARSLPCISATGTTLLPSRWPQRLGKVWSSIWIIAAPARSKSRTVRCVLSALPNPVSASTMTGMSTRSVMWASVWATSVAVVRPMSERPSRVYAMDAPDRYTASNPACCATSAVRASYTPGASKALGC